MPRETGYVAIGVDGGTKFELSA